MNMHSRPKGIKILGIVLFIAAAVFGLSYVVMYLWNYALVPGVGFGEINLWQAMAILVLSKILFTGIRPRRGGRKMWKRKWERMSAEDRERFKQKWERYCERRKDEDND